MTLQKVQYPGAGCVVEFMQGNAPVLAFVLESQGNKLRLITQNMRETTLAPARLLPWSGPVRGANLSRHSIAQLLGEHRKTRDAIKQSIDVTDLWELVQGEVEKASSDWLAGLLWKEPTIDHEAALGALLLETKTHFRFSPPDFEIFTAEKVELRTQEAEAARLREEIASAGTAFFRQLWELHQKGHTGAGTTELPVLLDFLEEKLKNLLFTRMAEPDSPEDETLWKQLCRGLPEHPHLALCLAVAWGLVPEHYNDLADRAHFTLGTEWIASYPDECRTLAECCRTLVGDCSLDLARNNALFSTPPRFISIDPGTTNDRDDAFYLERDTEGNFRLFVALACPPLCWPFDSALDKTVLRRATSLYLPEGDEHMLAPAIGWELFSLTEGEKRPVLLAAATFTTEGIPVDFSFHWGTLAVARNFSLEDVDGALAYLAAQEPGANSLEPSTPAAQETNWEQVFLGQETTERDASQPSPPAEEDIVQPYLPMLRDALRLAKLLQARRIGNGAVITERPDPNVVLHEDSGKITVSIEEQPTFALPHLIIGEFMIAANQMGATWACDNGVPLLYRTQDVAIPREFAGIWKKPHEISRVVKALPGASLETQPKKHAGLGITAYTSYTSPIRRYVDLLNQGQILSFLQNGNSRLSQNELEGLLPLLSSRNDSVGQIQRMRPRYWKLLFFRQQGDKKWWSGVITEETPAFVTVALPWAQIFLRGKRALFNEKLTLGQPVRIRIGKVDPLFNDMQILDVQEE